MYVMTKLINNLKESYNEMVHKVSWPTLKELRASSVLVVIGTFVFALLLWAIDTISGQGTKFLYDLLS